MYIYTYNVNGKKKTQKYDKEKTRLFTHLRPFILNFYWIKFVQCTKGEKKNNVTVPYSYIFLNKFKSPEVVASHRTTINRN